MDRCQIQPHQITKKKKKWKENYLLQTILKLYNYSPKIVLGLEFHMPHKLSQLIQTNVLGSVDRRFCFIGFGGKKSKNYLLSFALC